MKDSFKSWKDSYQVYVMRIWQEQTIPPVYRFSLEDPNTGHQRGFSCLPELVAYLEDETGCYTLTSSGSKKER